MVLLIGEGYISCQNTNSEEVPIKQFVVSVIISAEMNTASWYSNTLFSNTRIFAWLLIINCLNCFL